MIYIFDIDGTIADISHRLHYIKNDPQDWRGFFKACVDDCPIPETIRIAQLLKGAGANIHMISGRSEEIRQETVDWLRDFEVPCNALYMRQEGDHRQDNVVKGELLDDMIEHFNIAQGEIAGVFEDRKQVVDMYRARGLRVYQVADGNF